MDKTHAMRVEDSEPGVRGERLELLALVRGLEALPQPARVTVYSCSAHLLRMLNGGLSELKANDWLWEHHGEMVPVKNADLWRRVDRALKFHEVRVGRARVAAKTDSAEAPQETQAPLAPTSGAHRAVRELPAKRPWRPLPRRKSFVHKTFTATAVVCHRMRRFCRRLCDAVEQTSSQPSA